MKPSECSKKDFQTAQNHATPPHLQGCNDSFRSSASYIRQLCRLTSCVRPFLFSLDNLPLMTWAMGIQLRSMRPIKPTQSMQRIQSMQSIQFMQSMPSTQTEQYVQSTESMQSLQSTQSIQSIESMQSMQSIVYAVCAVHSF